MPIRRISFNGVWLYLVRAVPTVVVVEAVVVVIVVSKAITNVRSVSAWCRVALAKERQWVNRLVA